ncbi:MAG: MFS transporter, partial [Promethearchaeota archaeon]
MNLSNKGMSMISEEIQYSSKIHVSFAFGYFVRSFLFTVFAARVFAFYENEVRLNVTLVLIGYVIYGVWNMINDPLLGWISDKPNRFWKKYGRRFPWIVAMGVPYCFFIILVFIPPALNIDLYSVVIFIWFLVTICLYDAFYSGWMTNYYSLFPDKFRSDKERRKIAGIGSPLGLIASALGTLLPPLFIEYGNKQSYLMAMIVMSFISFGAFVISVPGSRETEEMKQRAMEFEREKETMESFLEVLKRLRHQKNFLAYLVAYLFFHSLTTIMLASIPYVVPYILRLPATFEIALSAGLLIGQLAGIALWIKVINKLGHRKLFMLGFFWAAIVLFPMIFLNNLVLYSIFIAILGFGVSSIYYGNQLIFSDCIDEIILESEIRQEGVFLG